MCEQARLFLYWSVTFVCEEAKGDPAGRGELGRPASYLLTAWPPASRLSLHPSVPLCCADLGFSISDPFLDLALVN
jgi:hypothetical protein